MKDGSRSPMQMNCGEQKVKDALDLLIEPCILRL